MWFSQVIKNYRQANNITQGQMQALIQNMHRSFLLLNKAAYYRWEQGKARPSVYRRCQILIGLGLKQCVARLSQENSDKFQLLASYMNHKFAAPLSSDVLYSSYDKLDYICDTYKNTEVDLSSYYGRSQEKIFKTKNISEFLSKINEQSHYSHFNLYREATKSNVISHLFSVIVDFQSLDNAICDHHEGLTRSFNSLSTYGFDSTEKVLFIMCNFSCTKEIFKHQLSIINTLLFENRDVSRVYIRSYDKELTQMVCKLYDGQVIHKPKRNELEESSWSGIVFDPVLFQLSQSLFTNCYTQCPHIDSEECSDNVCGYTTLA